MAMRGIYNTMRKTQLDKCGYLDVQGLFFLVRSVKLVQIIPWMTSRAKSIMLSLARLFIKCIFCEWNDIKKKIDLIS